MTENDLAGYLRPRESEWDLALGRYRDTCAEMRRVMDRAGAEGEDLPPGPVDAHEAAARALILTPGTHLLHVAQKVRALDNVLGLSANWPGVAEVLIHDLMQLIGATDSEQAFLPNSIMFMPTQTAA
ncbi:hypothetical protein [Novosphingobium sp. PP1Y]|uniref:hypothetical protein n=1 Tax=Novosphingobium sp. PP1Y TaxID=702113 RepID=UPI00059FD032|nr:hypothetical protein [Novosphingobium sp. PP1Y]